eukprot:g2717.t1
MLQFVRCFIGPRHASKLVLSTGLVIGGLLFTKAARRLLILFHKHVIRLNAHIVSEFNRYGYRIQLLLIFLVYPTITSITLRTFVCDEYPDSDGRPAYWLADDKVVRCDWHTAGSWNYGYQGMWVYAICMVFCVVFGLPALVLRILVPWRFNDRMYTVAEDGTEKPTDAALAELGALVMFKKSSWAMAIVDMFFKLVLTSLIGVLFHDHQIMGLAFGWMCCGCIIFVYAVQKPYIYEPANWIAVSSYFAILTGYTGAVADRLKMWSTKDPLTWQLRSVAKVIAEGSGKKLETYPSMNDIYTWHLIIAAMLKPASRTIKYAATSSTFLSAVESSGSIEVRVNTAKIVLTRPAVLNKNQDVLVRSSTSAMRTLSGGGKNRIFVVEDGATLTLNNLKLTAGKEVTGTASQPLPTWGTSGRWWLSMHQGINIPLSDTNTRIGWWTTSVGRYPGMGGAIIVLGTISSIDGCEFVANEAIAGGAILNAGVITEIRNTKFTSNEAGAGGAVYNVGDRNSKTGIGVVGTVEDCEFKEPHAGQSAQCGGFLYLSAMGKISTISRRLVSSASDVAEGHIRTRQ